MSYDPVALVRSLSDADLLEFWADQRHGENLTDIELAVMDEIERRGLTI